jgi:hypothetical protein
VRAKGKSHMLLLIVSYKLCWLGTVALMVSVPMGVSSASLGALLALRALCVPEVTQENIALAVGVPLCKYRCMRHGRLCTGV